MRESGRERPPLANARDGFPRYPGGSLTPRPRAQVMQNHVAQHAVRLMARPCCPPRRALASIQCPRGRQHVRQQRFRKERSMTLIKPRTRGKQLVRHRTRLRSETNETLYTYAHFIGEPTEYVLNQVIGTVLAKDQGLPAVANLASGVLRPAKLAARNWRPSASIEVARCRSPDPRGDTCSGKGNVRVPGGSHAAPPD